jgi:hypothetical protein
MRHAVSRIVWRRAGWAHNGYRVHAGSRRESFAAAGVRPASQPCRPRGAAGRRNSCKHDARHMRFTVALGARHHRSPPDAHERSSMYQDSRRPRRSDWSNVPVCTFRPCVLRILRTSPHSPRRQQPGSRSKGGGPRWCDRRRPLVRRPSPQCLPGRRSQRDQDGPRGLSGLLRDGQSRASNRRVDRAGSRHRRCHRRWKLAVESNADIDARKALLRDLSYRDWSAPTCIPCTRLPSLDAARLVQRRGACHGRFNANSTDKEHRARCTSQRSRRHRPQRMFAVRR